MLTGNVTVANGASLVIEAGVEVRSAGEFALHTEGSLTAVGTAADPITFSLDKGLRFLPGHSGSLVEWATIRDADCAVSLKSEDPQPTLRNIEFRNNNCGVRSEVSPQFLSFSDLRFFDTHELPLSLQGEDLALNRILIDGAAGTDIELGPVSGSFSLEESNLYPANPCASGQGCTVTVRNSEAPAVAVPYSFSNVWWGTTDQPTIDSLILDATDEPGERYASVIRTADATEPHDLYPPVSAPAISPGGATSSTSSVSGTASDSGAASSGISQVTASLKDLLTNEWWDGSDWGPTEQFLPTTGTSNWTLATPTLVSGHKYEVRSMAVDGSGLAQFGAGSAYFLVDTTPPNAFALLSPLDGAVTDATPSLAWAESADTGSGLDHYEVYIDGGNVAETLPGTESFDPLALAAGAHTWSVRAVDGAGNSRESEVRSFTVDTTPPNAFALLSPLDGAVTDATPSLAWAESADTGSGLDHYEVYIDGGNVAETLPGTESFDPLALAAGAHTWSVRAVDTLGNTRESETRSLIVASPPTAGLSVSSSPALTDTPVSLSASTSTPPPGGTITGFDWDFDGDGSYDQSTSSATIAHSYPSPGDFTVSVRVNSNLGTSSTAAAPLAIRRAPPSGPLGVSINDGAQFTNNPDVVVSAVWPTFATTMLVSNDGGFRKAGTFPVLGEVPWKLDSSGPERLPKTIYVRFQGGQAGAETYQDDIILDETDPEVLEASIGGTTGSTASVSRSNRHEKSRVVLRIRARDKLSGVVAMQVSRRKSNPGHWRTFRSTVNLLVDPHRIFVRVRDRAGNVSKWRLAKS